MTTTETSTGPTEGGARLQARGRRRARNRDPGGCRNACRGCSAGVRIPGHLRHVGDIPRTACRACPGTSPVTVPETVTFGAVTVLDGHDGHGRSPSPDMNFTVIITVDVRPDRIDEFVAGITTNAIASLRDEPGCLAFDVHRDQASGPHRRSGVSAAGPPGGGQDQLGRAVAHVGRGTGSAAARPKRGTHPRPRRPRSSCRPRSAPTHSRSRSPHRRGACRRREPAQPRRTSHHRRHGQGLRYFRRRTS